MDLENRSQEYSAWLTKYANVAFKDQTHEKKIICFAIREYFLCFIAGILFIFSHSPTVGSDLIFIFFLLSFFSFSLHRTILCSLITSHLCWGRERYKQFQIFNSHRKRPQGSIVCFRKCPREITKLSQQKILIH